MTMLVLALTLLGDPQDLLARLGSDSADERDAATQELIKLGRPAAELVKDLLSSPDPEIAARARLVVSAVTRVVWSRDIEAAIQTAKKENRHVLAIVAFRAGDLLSVANREMFGDAATVDFVREKFVAVWSTAANGAEPDHGLATEAPKTPPEQWGHDYMGFIASPDGKIVHAFYGGLSAEDFRDELAFALEVSKRVADGKTEEVQGMHAEHCRRHADVPAAGRFTKEWRRQVFANVHAYGQSMLGQALNDAILRQIRSFLNPEK